MRWPWRRPRKTEEQLAVEEVLRLMARHDRLRQAIDLANRGRFEEARRLINGEDG